MAQSNKYPKYSMQIWRLNTPTQTIIFYTTGQMPAVAYWGKSLPKKENLITLIKAQKTDITGANLDITPPLSLCPQQHDSFPGHLGLRLFDGNGKMVLANFRLQKTHATRQNIEFICVDSQRCLTMHFYINAYDDSNILTLQSELFAPDNFSIDWLTAPVLPLAAQSDHCLEFSGRWCGEFQINKIPWNVGTRLRESVTGRSGHETFPALIVAASSTTNSTGFAYGLHYGDSSGHRMICEQLPDRRRQVQFGAASGVSRNFAHHKTALLFASYSSNGFNGLAKAFQTHVRHHIVRFPVLKSPRPVHYNCWEAVYFNHDVATLKSLAKQAAKLGAERFVLDDGWFLNRNNDTSSLGDWQVDRRKYPNSLSPLISYINRLGLSFGLWLEPEMISKKSRLYQKNPQWVLGTDKQITGRQQLVLDLKRDVVLNYLFDTINALLMHYNIEYIKWDHNRVLPFPDTAQSKQLYILLNRLRQAHPNVEFESCASGGGRIDYGILQYCQRVWLSDSHDALERFTMQHNACLFLPSEITGSHVGAEKCHTSGRVLPLVFRAWVAAGRHMGFELDPRNLTQADFTALQAVTQWYKDNRHWLHRGHIQRLDCEDSAQLGEIQIANDGHRFVAFLAQMQVSRQMPAPAYRLCGLEPQAFYKVHLHTRSGRQKSSRHMVTLYHQDLILSGQYLMHCGLILPDAFPATMWVIEGTRQK